MLATGQTLSVGVTDLRALLLKLIVLSVKYVSKRDIWGTRFGEDYVDWNLVDGVQASKSLLGGTAEWLGLLELCRWEELSRQEGAVHPLVRAVRKHMKECGLDTGDATGWTLACKIFLIMLLQGVPSLHTLEVLTCAVFKMNTQAGCTMLLAKQVRASAVCLLFRLALTRIGRPRTCTRPPCTSRPCTLCWTGARWTRRRWSRPTSSCWRRWTTARSASRCRG